MIIPQPASFQAISATISSAKESELVMKGWIEPELTIAWLMRPAPPSICWNSAMTSTQERKCGRYTIDWNALRSRWLIIESTMSASRIGSGKNSTSWNAA